MLVSYTIKLNRDGLSKDDFILAIKHLRNYITGLSLAVSKQAVEEVLQNGQTVITNEESPVLFDNTDYGKRNRDTLRGSALAALELMGFSIASHNPKLTDTIDSLKRTVHTAIENGEYSLAISLINVLIENSK